jgi:hypothetical protein
MSAVIPRPGDRTMDHADTAPSEYAPPENDVPE